jgi:hypothetical protein
MKDAKTIPGFPGYLITKSGELFSSKKGEPTRIKGSTWQGYQHVKLMNGKTLRSTTVHRLVAEAFLTRPRGKNMVNHLDGDKLNNKVSNLEWTNHRGNMDHYKEKLAPAYKVKKVKQKQDLVNVKLSVVKFAHTAYKDQPELFSKLFSVTFDMS